MANGDNDTASDWKVGLTVYLAAVMLLMVYLVYTVWAAEPKPEPAVPPAGTQQAPAADTGDAGNAAASEVPVKNTGGAGTESQGSSSAQQQGTSPPPASGTPAQPAPARPVIERLEPSTVEIGSGQVTVSIHGSRFDGGSTVTIRGAPRSHDFVSAEHLVVHLAALDIVSPGPAVVRVSTKAGVSDGAVLTILSASAKPLSWKVFGFDKTINQDIRLILLVLITGALGACVAGLQSLADYIGNERFKSSWGAFYIVRPAIGAGVAFVFYLVLRGGLASGAGFDPAAVNPFGLTAVAALVGMFSDKAMLKLQEIFVTLFKADDTRKDKLKVFDITTGVQLRDAKVGDPYTQKLEVSGGSSPFTWTAEGSLPAWLGLDGTKGELSGTPPAAKEETFTIRVKDAVGAMVTREFKLKVKP